MQLEDKNKTNTCDQNINTSIVPIPARVTAMLVRISESYVKKYDWQPVKQHGKGTDCHDLRQLTNRSHRVLLNEGARVFEIAYRNQPTLTTKTMITKAIKLINRVINQQASGMDYTVFTLALIFLSLLTAYIALSFMPA